MNIAIKEENEKIFEVAKKTAKKFFYIYKGYLSSASLDIDDLVQEAYITVYLNIERYHGKNNKEIFKLCNQAVKWRLLDILNCVKKKYLVVGQDEGNELSYQNRLPLYVNENLLNEYQNKEDDIYKRFKFQELVSILSEFEYNVLYQIVLYKKSFRELGKEYSCSQEWINKTYKKALIKAKNYLNFNNN